MPQDTFNLAAAVRQSQEREAQRREQGAGAALYTARQIPAEQAAVARRAASVLGVSPLEVENNRRLVQDAEAIRTAEALRGHHATINWLSNPENAAVAHDQVDGLLSFEQAFQRPFADEGTDLGDLQDRGPGRRLSRASGDYIGGIMRRLPGELISTIGRTFDELNAGAARRERAIFGDTPYARMLDTNASVARRITMGGQNIGGTATGQTATDIQALLAWQATPPAERGPLPTRGDPNPSRRANARLLPQTVVDTGLAGDVAGATGQVGGQILMGAATGGTATLPSLYGQGATAMGERVDQARVRDGRTEFTAQDEIAIAAGGIVTGLSEKLGLDAILGRLPKPLRDRLTNRLAHIVVAGAVEGSTEVVEGVGHNLLASSLLDEDTGAFDGTVEGGTVGAITGSLVRALILTAIPGRQHVENQIRSEAAVADAARFDSLIEMAGASPLATRSPDALRSFLANVSEDEQVYVPAEAAATFFQSNPDLEQWIDEWDIRDQYEAALAGGSDIAIPAAVYLTQVAQTEAHAAWSQDLRHGMNAMSLREAEAFAANGEASLGESFDAAIAQADEIGREAAPAQAVYQDLFSQLRAAGYTVDAATKQATLATAYFTQRAAASGGRFPDAMAAYRDANLSIRQEFPQAVRERMDRVDVLIEALRQARKPVGQRAMFGRSLAEFISQEGGMLDTGGELAAMGADQWHRSQRFRRKLVRARSETDNSAYEADSVLTRAIEAGYLREDATVDDLRAAIQNEIAGRPLYSQSFERDPTVEDNRQALDDLEEVLANLGIDPATATNAEIKAALEAFSNAPEVSPGVAYDQAKAAARVTAETYKAMAGISKPEFIGPVQPVAEDMQEIADALEAAEHTPSDPTVAASYSALIDETVAQFLAMGDISVEAWRGEGEPYANSQAMLADVRDNGHLWFFQTEAGFGEGADTSGHPLLRPTGITMDDGTELLANDLFRIVHDYFGHAQQGFNFGPVGELNAYLEHETMYSDAAVPALAAETLMQNAWVNFGPHLRREDGSLPVRGDEDYIPIPQRRFADQKAFIATPEVIALAEKAKGAKGQTFLHGSVRGDLTLDDIQTDGRTDSKQGKKGRVYGGFYVTEDEADAERYSKATEGDATIYEVELAPDAKVLELERDGQIERLTPEQIAEWREQGYAAVRGKNIIGTRTEVAIIDRSKVKKMGPRQAERQTLNQPDGSDSPALARPPVNPDGTVTLTHWSLDADLSETDPTKWGRNWKIMSRDERNRISSHLPRTFFGIGVGLPGGYSKELGTGENVYVASIDAARLYDAAADPDGFRDNLEGVPTYDRINQIERQIAENYDGYWLKSGLGLTATMFKPVEVQAEAAAFGQSELSSAALRAWFGDSKVVDANGDPLVVYHGTEADFDAFDTSGAVADVGGRGAYFSASSAYARVYAGDGGQIMPVYLSIKNPLIIPAGKRTFAERIRSVIDRKFKRQIENRAWNEAGRQSSYISDERIALLEAEGYDGIINEGVNEIVAFRPEQIKSAFNRGTFDATDPRILYQSDAPPFFSALTRAVGASQTKAAPPAQWKATLAKTAGVKKEELEWSGVNDWLDLQTEGNVSRDDVLAFLRAGGVRVDEVVLGGRGTDRADVDRAATLYMEGGMTPEDAYEAAWGEAVDTQQQRLPQFSDWKLPGADESYRELLLTLPSLDGPATHWDTDNVVAHARLTERMDAEGRKVLFIEEVQSDWHQKGRDQGYRQSTSADDVAAAHAAYDVAVIAARSAEADLLQTAQDLDLEPSAAFGSAFDSLGLTDKRRAVERTMREALDNQALHPKVLTRINDALDAWTSADLRRIEASNASSAAARGIPNAPFRTSWPALVMKRMIRWAVDHGYDRVAWTTGEQQAERYSLSDAVGGIHAERRSDGDYEVTTDSSQAMGIIRDNGMASASERGFDMIVMSAEQMRQAFGGNIAEQVIAGADASAAEWAAYDRIGDDILLAELEGDDAKVAALQERAGEMSRAAPTRRGFRVEGEESLRVGGEGMKAFYDRNLVNITNDLIKRYGARVGPMRVRGVNDAAERPAGLLEAQEAAAPLELEFGRLTQQLRALSIRNPLDGPAELQRRADELRAAVPPAELDADEMLSRYERAARELEAGIPAAERWLELRDQVASSQAVVRSIKQAEPAYTDPPQPGFDITPQLRDAAMSGFPLFQRTQTGPRGQIALSPEGAAITLFKGRDLSTFFHEFGHLMLDLLVRDASDPAATEAQKQNLRVALDYMNVRDPADIGVDQHELWARSFEAYLLEGKSPSLELRSIFKSIKAWLDNIYRTALSLNAPITDDIRGLFDRLLATEEEIASRDFQATVDAGFTEAEQAGMSAPEFADYQRLVERARAASEDDLLQRVMRSIRRERTAEWNAEADAARPEVAAEIDEQPDIKALGWLRGSKTAMARETVVKMLGDEAGLALLPKAVPPIVGVNGVHPDSVAEVAGYGSGQEMLNGLMELEAERQAMRALGDKRSVRAKRIDDGVTALLRERIGDPLNDGSIEAEALASLHSERQAEVLGVELSALARRVGQNPAPLSALRAWAVEKIGSRTVREARPGKYLRAERTAATAAQKALAAGDRAEAFRQKQAQTINHLLYSEARKAEEFSDKALRRLSRLAKARTLRSIDQDYLEQAHALLEQYELKAVSGTQVQRRASLLAWVTEKQAAGEDVVVPAALLEAAARRNYADLTVDELRGLNDTVMQIIALGRLKKTLIVKGEARDANRVADEAAASAAHLPNVRRREGFKDKEGWFRSLADFGVAFEASMVKVQEWCRLLDGGDMAGIFASVLDRPGLDASNRQTRLDAEFFTPIIAAERAIPNAVKKHWLDIIDDHPFMNPETGERLAGVRRRDLLSAALNSGALSNYENLAKGWGMLARDADPVAISASHEAFIAYLDSQLDPTEWAYVQAWWSAFDQQQAAYFATARALNGYAPDPVEAIPVQTKAGLLTGGYVPISYDPRYDKLQQERDKADTADIFGGAMRAGPRPDNGSTKERTGYSGPIHLDLDKLAANARKHITYISHGEYVANALRFINHPVVAQTIKSKLGDHAYAGLEPWLASQVGETAALDPSANPFIRAARWSRNNMTAAILLGSVSVLLAQPGGLAISASQLGTARLARGMMKAYALGLTGKFHDFVFTRSEFMKNRLNEAGLDRDIRAALAKNKGKRSRKEMAAFLAGKAIAAVDVYLVSGPTWIAAYDQALAEGREEAEAIYVADRAAESTQGGGRAASLSAIQSKNEITKMVTFAYGWANAFYNLQRGAVVDLKNGVERGNAAYRLAALTILPALADALLSGDWPDFDDDDEGPFASAVGWAARNIFFQSFSGVPILRDVAGNVERRIEGKYVGSTGQTAWGRMFDEVSKLGNDAWAAANPEDDKEPSKRWPSHVINSTGLVFGLPGTTQASRTTNYLLDVEAGDQNPDGVIDWIAGILKGPQEAQE